MEHIGPQLAQTARNIKIRGADAATLRGFTQVPNFVLESQKVSPGAKLVYTMLLKYAWHNNFCYPGQERLATDMGVTSRSVISYMQELQREGFVLVERRGQGKPNLYELLLKPVRRHIQK